MHFLPNSLPVEREISHPKSVKAVLVCFAVHIPLLTDWPNIDQQSQEKKDYAMASEYGNMGGGIRELTGI
jgi:hypothetical protein